MSFWEAVLLGVVQGFTEWLPISSTAHLMVFDALARGKDAGAGFTAVIQLGTLLACIIYFRRDIIRLLLAWLNDFRQMSYGTSHDARLAWMIIVGTIPVVFFGLAFKKYIRADLRNLYVVGTAAIVFAILLFIAEKVVHARAAGEVWLRRRGDWLEACPDDGLLSSAGSNSRSIPLGDHHNRGLVRRLDPLRRGAVFFFTLATRGVRSRGA